MIRFAGVDLLLDDPAGTISTWLDRYMPLDDLRLFGPHLSARSPLWQSRGQSCKHLGIPVVNYPPPPRLALNTLYWPTGATRWAYGVFLTDDDGLEEILRGDRAAGGGAVRRSKLVLAESDFPDDIADSETAAGGFHSGPDGQFALVTEMRLLQPRPISIDWDTSEEPVKRLWLLPLVDDRYFWQFAHADLSSGMTSTWTELLGAISTALGVTTLDGTTISADFGSPDATDTTRSWQNAAVLLDAVAHSVGMRVVRDCGTGDVSLQSSGAGYTLATAALSDGARRRLMGGEIGQCPAASVAETVVVVFRNPNGTVEIIEESAADHGVTQTNGGTRVFHVPSIDPFTADTPTAESSALAAAIAEAYYGFSLLEYDVTYSGFQRWKGSSFDDCAIFSLGATLPDGTRRATTRVWSMPPNVGVDVLLNRADDEPNDDDCESYPNLHGCADADWVAGGTVVVSVHDEDGDTGRNVTARAIGIDGLQGTHGDLIPVEGYAQAYKFWPDECDPTCGVSA